MELYLIEHATVYTPTLVGQQSILVAGEKILKIGEIDAHQLVAAGLECETIDASGCVAVPGLIDPHEHLLGAGGEHGFASRMPEVMLSELVTAGITTVVGLLGTDTSTRHLPCLLAKTKQLGDEGLTAYMYTGGFELPPSTITGSLTDDLMMIEQIIGTGEVAISDERWIDPTQEELAHAVAETKLGGMMSGKAGVTHFHVGSSKRYLALLHNLLGHYEISPQYIYATHITRSPELLEDAIELAQQGIFVDMDTVEEDLGHWLRYYREHGGPMDQLTVSSDAHTPGGSPSKLYGQFVDCIHNGGFSLAEVLPLFTRNTARVLKLDDKGKLEKGKAADILLLHKDTLEIRHLLARGKQFIKDGQIVEPAQQERQIEADKAPA